MKCRPRHFYAIRFSTYAAFARALSTLHALGHRLHAMFFTILSSFFSVAVLPFSFSLSYIIGNVSLQYDFYLKEFFMNTMQR